MDSDEGIVMMMATTLIGVLCGYLDWLAWRQSQPKNSGDAMPNMGVAGDCDPRERGSRPLNTRRYVSCEMIEGCIGAGSTNGIE